MTVCSNGCVMSVHILVLCVPIYYHFLPRSMSGFIKRTNKDPYKQLQCRCATDNFIVLFSWYLRKPGSIPIFPYD